VLVAQVFGADSGDDQFLSRFNGDTAALADVFDELRTVPLFSDRRLVVVDDADKLVSAHRKELEAYVQKPAARGTLILQVKTWPATTRLAKLLETHGLHLECKSPAERELPAWLTSEAKVRWGLKLDQETARLLLELVGADLGQLVSELEKLATHVGNRPIIDRDDVLRMVGTGRVETIWKLLDAATTGDAHTALDDLDRLLASGEHPVGLLAAMSASLRKVHHAGKLRLRKLDASQACREAGIPPFAVQNTLNQHTHLGPSRVAGLPGVLLQADLDLKGASSLPARTIMERLVVYLAQPRTD
jgi:DNA polymerase-3 subunit delta